jgi:hypothetical protein
MPKSMLLRKLPSPRVLIAAGIGLISYFVTSVLKSDIDDEIKGYSSVISQASGLEKELSSWPTLKGSLDFWSQTIELQKQQLTTLSNLPALTGKVTLPLWERAPVADYQAGVTVREKTLSYARISAYQFFANLQPGKLRHIEVDPKEFAFAANREDAKSEVLVCIHQFTDGLLSGPFGLSLSESNFLDRYSELFYGYFREGAVSVSAKEGIVSAETSATVETIASDLNSIAEISRAAAIEMAGVDPYEGTGLLLPTDDLNLKHWKAGQISDLEHASIECADDMQKMVVDAYIALSSKLRDGIDKDYMQPLRRRARWIEKAEIVLYVASAIVALFGDRRGPADDRPPPLDERSAERIIRLREMKPRRLHRSHKWLD